MSSRSRSPNIVLVQQADQRNDRIAMLDSSHSVPISVDSVHHEIHEGHHFTVVVVDTDVDIAGPKYVRITTPNTVARMHFEAMVSADGAVLVEFYEDPTLLAAGAALTERNNDRNSSVTSVATTFEDTTTQAPNNDGTLLFAFRAGGTGVGQTRISAELSKRQEWVLKQNEDYLVKVTADADNTEVIVVFAWYEHGI